MTSIMGQCPTCGACKNADVIAEHDEILGEDSFHTTVEYNTYRILKCAGCDEIYFQRERVEVEVPDDDHSVVSVFPPLAQVPLEYILNEEKSHWPAPSAKQRDWGKLSDSPLLNLLTDVSTALERDLRVLAAIGLRTAFDIASELLGVEPSKSFGKKLDQLNKDGYISSAEKENLQVLTDAGGAAAHRGWEPNREQLNVLVLIMEQFRPIQQRSATGRF
jgi:Domain of unknown function (DUF4145)